MQVFKKFLDRFLILLAVVLALAPHGVVADTFEELPDLPTDSWYLVPDSPAVQDSLNTIRLVSYCIYDIHSFGIYVDPSLRDALRTSDFVMLFNRSSREASVFRFLESEEQNDTESYFGGVLQEQGAVDRFILIQELIANSGPTNAFDIVSITTSGTSALGSVTARNAKEVFAEACGY